MIKVIIDDNDFIFNQTDMIKWCMANLGSLGDNLVHHTMFSLDNVDYIWQYDLDYFYFKFNEDAIQFKLTFI